MVFLFVAHLKFIKFPKVHLKRIILASVLLGTLVYPDFDPHGCRLITECHGPVS